MARKNLSEDQIKYTVNVEVEEAQKQIHKLNGTLSDLKKKEKELRREMLEQEVQGKKNQGRWNALNKQLRELTPKIRKTSEEIKKQTAALNTNDMSMAQLRSCARELQRELNNIVPALQPEKYEELSGKLNDVNKRMADLKHATESWKDAAMDDNSESFFWSSIRLGVIEKVKNSFVDICQATKELMEDSIKLAEEADGVTKAFNELNQPNLLDDLRTATKGTVTDVELMKAAVQAKDFRIPLEDLGKYLQFAQLKAQQTGQSVEYMTQSIVTGLGRKSVMILDNLGLSAAEINEQVAKTGDFMKAVANIVDTQLAAAGDNYVSAADRALQKATELKNAQLELGNTLLPYKEELSSVFGSGELYITKFLNVLLKHRKIVAAVTVALSLFVATSALTNKALWQMVANTKAATTAMTIFNTACKTNVFVLLGSVIAGVITYLVAFREKTSDATKATKELSAEQKELNRVQTETNAQLQKDIATLNTFKGSKEQEIELVKQMNARYGESMGYYKSVQEWYNALVRNSKAYCEQMVIEAQVRSLANQAAQAEQEAYNIKKDSQGRTRKYSKKRQTERVATGQVDAGDGKIITTYETREKAGSSDLEKAQASYNQKMKEANALKARMNQLLEKQLKLQTQLKTGAKTDPFIVSTPSPAKTKTANASSGSHSGQTEDPEAALKAQIEALQQYYDQVDQVTAMGEQEVQMTLTAQRQAELETLRAYVQAGLELARQAGADENAIVEAGKRAKEAIIKKYADKELELAQATEEKKQQAREQLGLDQKTELELQTERLKEALDQQYITQEEYEKQVQKLKKQSYEKQAQMYQQLFANAVTALQDAEMANVDAKYDAQIEAARQAGEDTTELENKKAQDKLNIEKKYADVNFAIKASQIISDTAVSIMKAYADLGPIAGSVAAALMGITGAAQLAAANAERERVKKMTLSGSTSTSASGSRVATGLESGGRIDVERRQDGKLFNAYYDPNRRGFIDRPTVIVGEGPAGQSREWVASNAAVTNPTIAPLLDVIDRAQQNGTVRTLDLRRFLALQTAGRSNGGTITATENSNSPSVRTQADVTTQPVTSLSEKTMAKLADAIDRMTTDGVAAIVGLDEFDARQRLRSRSRAIGSKN